MIRWIFFDVGSTLVDEAAAYDHRAKDMILGTDITFEQFDEMRINLARQGYDGNSAAIKAFGLKKTPWHSEDEVPYPDAEGILGYLKDRGYQLGIIANQPMGTDQRLACWGLRHYFDLIAASAEMGVAKPDRELFEKALALANCSPEDAVMVGDRLDNDIVPAKKTGFRTVWIRQGLSVYQPPELGQKTADYVINTLSELRDIF